MWDEIGSRSESQSKVGEKRISAQFGEKLERCKRVKMRDLDSVCRSEEMKESNRRSLSGDKEKSQEPLKDAAIPLSEISQTEITSKKIPNKSAPIKYDPKGLDLDLNTNNESISPKKDPSKNRKNLKLGDVSECGSTTGPLENNDPMRVWKEMKQNGFLSSSYVSIPVPKKRGRKSKTDELKKKMDLAKKEQVDRFVKIAAPSGLLNDLNPGIINHVRNRKQVHAIIEGLVRLEKKENHKEVEKQVNPTRSSIKDDHFGLSENAVADPEIEKIYGLGGPGSLRGGHAIERWFLDKDSRPLLKKEEMEDDILTLKLASSTAMATEGVSCLSSEETANSSLSLKAATVAFHWLELLQQDIKGRLAALRRSKNRVRSVISTELPFLMSREFSSGQENDPSSVKDLVNGCSYNAIAKAHRAKWSTLFDQMDKSLSEEEKQLENWWQQVKEMQLQCQKGLHQFHPQAVNGSQTNLRLVEVDKSERELAVRAAAASIYSTCNFLSSSENLPCY